jgi:hypothetical protein
MHRLETSPYAHSYAGEVRYAAVARLLRPSSILSAMARTNPERSTTMKAILSLVAVSLAAVGLAVSASAADKYIPGVTDFPSAAQAERYIPGVTDFPSYAPEAPTAAVEVYVSDGFDWLDAALGAAVGLAIGALAAAALLAQRRRTGFSTA